MWDGLIWKWREVFSYGRHLSFNPPLLSFGIGLARIKKCELLCVKAELNWQLQYKSFWQNYGKECIGNSTTLQKNYLCMVADEMCSSPPHGEGLTTSTPTLLFKTPDLIYCLSNINSFLLFYKIDNSTINATALWLFNFFFVLIRLMLIQKCIKLLGNVSLSFWCRRRSYLLIVS